MALFLLMPLLLLMPLQSSVAREISGRLENQTYSQARKSIQAYGWQSYKDAALCSSNNKKDSCTQTPELYWCKFALNCEISFFKDDKCLYLGVKGGPRWNSYYVKKVRFARGSQNCPSRELPHAFKRLHEKTEITDAPDTTAASMTKAIPKMPADPISVVKKSRFNLPSCSELKAQNLSEDDLITHLENHYPAELVSVDTVEDVELSSHDLTQLTGYVACVASLTPGPYAPESALALFASKRYGNSAMAALKKRSQGSTVEAKAAKQFVEQITAFLAGPTE